MLSDGMSATVALDPAVWTLEVKGYADSARTDLKVTGRTGVSVIAGTASSVDVYLTPGFSSGGAGSLAYSISFPAEVSRAFFVLYPLDAPGDSREIDISGTGGAASGTLADLPEGSYLALIDLYDSANNKAAVWTGAAHIYDGLSTPLAHTIAAAGFAACGPAVAGATLAAKLNVALELPSGSYTIILDGMETDLAAFAPKPLTVTDNKNITVTIRGNGNEVQLSGNGSLFTLGATSGSSLTLILQDITLRGRSDNNNSLVQVESGGTLETKAGSLITGNTNSDSSGGGVYVGDNGTFTMSGGVVSGNSTSGVSVGDNGAFSMSGGAVSGNAYSGVSVSGGPLA
jgi:hypothetical protein